MSTITESTASASPVHAIGAGGGLYASMADGMARPGTIKPVPGHSGAPWPLDAAAGAIALAFSGQRAPVWLSAGLRSTAVPDWLALHASAALTPEKAQARLAFIETGAPLPSLGLFSAGRQESLDGSALLVIGIEGFASVEPLKLTGPGIAGGRIVHPQGLPDGFLRQWAENHLLFPRGVDVVLTAGNQFFCLPRTTRISPAGA